MPGFNFPNGYTYDAASNRTSLTAPDGSITTYGYDTLNRLNGLANSWAGSFGFSYDALSRRTQLDAAERDQRRATAYDSVSHLLSVLHQAGANTLDGASYTYDPAGNRTAKTNDLNAITSSYTYDPLYELTQVTQGASTTETYSYDFVGNRLSSSGVPTYNYNLVERVDIEFVRQGYTYDANGNTLSDAPGPLVSPGIARPSDSGCRIPVYFVEARPGSTIRGEGESTSSRPISREAFLYDGNNLIETVSGSEKPRSPDYANGGDLDQPYAELRSGTVSYFQEQDAANSVTSLSNSTGALANTYTYDSFGNVTNSTGTLRNPFQYTAREFDQETSLYYYRARYYDAETGRFISEDPMGFDAGVNFYAYVENNPINYIDPSGLCKEPNRFWNCVKNYYGFGTAATRIGTGLAGIPFPKSWVGEARALGSGPFTTLPSWLSKGAGTAASGTNLARMGGRIAGPIAIGGIVIDAAALAMCEADYVPQFIYTIAKYDPF